jgi:hypothetical protein
MVSATNAMAAMSRRHVRVMTSPQHAEEQTTDRAEPKHDIAQLTPKNTVPWSIQSHGAVSAA